MHSAHEAHALTAWNVYTIAEQSLRITLNPLKSLPNHLLIFRQKHVKTQNPEALSH